MNQIISIFLALLITACTNPRVYHLNDQKDLARMEDSKPEDGFIYTLPKTAVTIRVTATIQHWKKGHYSEFAHLINYPTGRIIQEDKSSIKITGVEIAENAIPDYNKIYLVKGPLHKYRIKQSDIRFTLTDGGMLTNSLYDTGKGDPYRSIQLQPATLDLNRSSRKNKRAEARGNFYEITMQDRLNYLLEQTKQLNAQIDELSPPGEEGEEPVADSVVLKEFASLKSQIRAYQAEINEMKETYRTYKGEEIANTAKRYSDIIHKLIQLKMELAGAQGEIDYANVPVQEMVIAIDETIDTYLATFKGEEFEETVTWTFRMVPDTGRMDFEFPIYKVNGEFVTHAGITGAQPVALIRILYHSGMGAFVQDLIGRSEGTAVRGNVGLFYNIPAWSDVEVWISAIDDGYSQKLAETSISLPQLGSVASLPADFDQVRYELDPRSGGLKKIIIKK